MNTTVTATGMNVEAVADGNLLIGLTQVPDKAEISFGDANTVTSLVPCTYFSAANEAKGITAAGYWAADNTSGWVANNGGVETGKETDEKYKAAVVAGTTGADEVHYIDYVMYIAAASALENYNLTATITITAAEGTIGNFTHKALSIDMKTGYAVKDGSLSAVTWDDLSAAAVKMNVAENATGGIISNVSVLANGTIGEVYSNETIAVIFRVYYDGALQTTGDNPTYYVQSNNIDMSGLNIVVDFAAAEA